MEQAKKRPREDTTDPAPTRDWEVDLILFAHLLPCCQHYVEGYKSEFEETMNSRSQTLFGDKTVFLTYLLGHPKNTWFLAQVENWRSESPVTVSVDELVTWEMLLCLMRNPLSHEYTFDWRWLTEMAYHALVYFKSRENIEDMIKLYELGVIKSKSLNPLIVGSGSNHLFPRRWDMTLSLHERLQDSYNLDVWGDILFFFTLIPCRSLNSMIDVSFEEEMDYWASRKQFGSWEMYLKTHPANPEQLQTKLSDITWLTAIRLARNIICHERNWNWNGLLELKHHMLAYFNSMKTISEMFELYRKCCSGNLRVYEATEEEMADNKLYAKLHTPAAFIQIEHSDSAVISPLEDLGRVSIFVGIDTINYLVDRWSKLTSKLRGRNNYPLVVYGPPRSGKTTIAKYVVPHLLIATTSPAYGASYINLGSVLDDCRLDRLFVELAAVLSRHKRERASPAQLRVLSPQEQVTNILLHGSYQYHVIIFDEFEKFYGSLTQSEREQLIAFLKEEMKACDLKFIFITARQPRSLVGLLEGSPLKFGTTETLDIALPLFVLDTTQIPTQQGIGDAKRLARYYYGIDKYKLEEFIDYEDFSYAKMFQDVISFIDQNKRPKL